jgi:hypothetical protein
MYLQICCSDLIGTVNHPKEDIGYYASVVRICINLYVFLTPASRFNQNSDLLTGGKKTPTLCIGSVNMPDNTLNILKHVADFNYATKLKSKPITWGLDGGGAPR